MRMESHALKVEQDDRSFVRNLITELEDLLPAVPDRRDQIGVGGLLPVRLRHRHLAEQSRRRRTKRPSPVGKKSTTSRPGPPQARMSRLSLSALASIVKQAG